MQSPFTERKKTINHFTRHISLSFLPTFLVKEQENYLDYFLPGCFFLVIDEDHIFVTDNFNFNEIIATKQKQGKIYTLPSLIIIFGFLKSAPKIQGREVISFYSLRSILKLLIHQLNCKENIFVNYSAEKCFLH